MLPADDNGSTDPYACIEYLDSFDKTRPLFKSLNPVFFQKLIFKINFKNYKIDLELIIKIKSSLWWKFLIPVNDQSLW